jgi:hypothetical protein
MCEVVLSRGEHVHYSQEPWSRKSINQRSLPSPQSQLPSYAEQYVAGPSEPFVISGESLEICLFFVPDCFTLTDMGSL